ncbi:pullulanase-type alpha-1,6-glucosidase [Streptosporangium sp. NPDC050855]|uniref:pullulanase-type alpha-1,6-glucosidase n=1 Tax=Streptosporangium sp. NPDC050855 TaxID=3366194 RepID=UPI0037B2528F
MSTRSRRVAPIAIAALLLLGLLHVTTTPAAWAQDQPDAVAVAGDFGIALGCSSDWAPDCDAAQLTRRENDGVWALTARLPEGTYGYKAALDKSWAVNYGLHATPGGSNIPLTVPAGEGEVTFLYDHATHWITDTIAEPIATAAGDFQSELGCPADWSPDCLRSWLTDPDGDGTYTFTTTAIPAGTYKAKATLGMSWKVNYGEDGVPGGADIPFTVDADGATTTFGFDSATHTMTVYAGQARPSLQIRKAHWLTPQIIAWNPGGDLTGQTYQLAAAADGGLTAGATGIGGGTVVPLTHDPAGLPPALKAKFPHLASLAAFRIPAAAATRAAELLRGQVAVAALDADGALVNATGLQIPGVLDALYAATAVKAALGPVHHGRRPTLSVWAPTAQSVSVELYDTATSATSATARLVPMRRDDATGVWSVTGDRDWNRKFYRYRVKVFAPTASEIVTNSVTDPYSLALSTDSERSQIVDLSDHDLAPRGWNRSTAPEPVKSTRLQIQELHVRDFSVEDATVPAADRGTYLAFTHGRSAGMRHLKALAKAGATTVHLLPAFDFAGTVETRADQARPPCDLASFAADSDQQQACVAKTQAGDGYNWGYNPLHYTVPEGSYATDPDGTARIVQFRRMVQAIHDAGLGVVLDVVYNHTAAAGQADDAVLDRIVPGYYQRLSSSGTVTTDSCCADTAPEHAMMNKLVVDSVTTWAKQYRIDGFRFDLMGLDPKQTMLDTQAALARLTPRRDGVDGKNVYLYGEGWNYGIVANNARFVQATQPNMAGTGIGTFNDRLRDAVRGGKPDDPRTQGFASGLLTLPNGDAANGTAAQQRTNLLAAMDLIKIGLTGNLKDYTFTAGSGTTVKGSDLDYNGEPAGYAAAPGEAVTYVDAHDNLALYDALTYKLPAPTSMKVRGRLQALALATTALSQGPGLIQAGSDLLRSKSLDDNSYDSGDWFNAVHWDCADGNGFGRGLPLAESNRDTWPLAKPLLADPALVPGCRTITDTTDAYQQFLGIKRSSPLFSLTTSVDVQKRLTFPLSGTAGEIPGVITQHLDGTGLRGADRSVTVIYNATANTQTQTLTGLIGTRRHLHPAQRKGTDPIVKRSAYDPATGTFTVPAHTVAVFVQR